MRLIIKASLNNVFEIKKKKQFNESFQLFL